MRLRILNPNILSHELWSSLEIRLFSLHFTRVSSFISYLRTLNMASVASIPSIPSEEEWLVHKPAIRQLFLVKGKSLEQLVVELQRRGLAATLVSLPLLRSRIPKSMLITNLFSFRSNRNSQLERKLKQWGFKKNLSREAWISVGHRIRKRKDQGKASGVSVSGVRLKPSAIQKGASRYQEITLYQKFSRGMCLGYIMLPNPW